jgi:hypothetical protein
MDPAGRFENRSWFAIGLVELVVTTVSVSLEDPGVVGEMRLRMLASSIARIILETAVSDLLPTENRAFSMA